MSRKYIYFRYFQQYDRLGGDYCLLLLTKLCSHRKSHSAIMPCQLGERNKHLFLSHLFSFSNILSNPFRLLLYLLPRPIHKCIINHNIKNLDLSPPCAFNDYHISTSSKVTGEKKSFLNNFEHFYQISS